MLFISFQKDNSLINIWEEQSDIKHEWISNNCQFIQFTEENKLLILDGHGVSIEKYDYVLTPDSIINLSNGRKFGKLIKATNNELIIEKEIKRGNLIHTISAPYSSIKTSKIDTSLTNVSEHIFKYEWEGNADSNSGESAKISMKFNSLNDNKGKINIQSKDFTKEYLVEIANFKDSYSIYLEDIERPHKSDWMKIDKIGVYEIQIIFLELPSKTLTLKRKI